MTKQTVAVNGVSGANYNFAVHARNSIWNPVAGIYVVLQKNLEGNYAPIYVGETDNLSKRFQCHHKQTCFDRHHWTHLGFLFESNSVRRLTIERDILVNFNWACNG